MEDMVLQQGRHATVEYSSNGALSPTALPPPHGHVLQPHMSRRTRGSAMMQRQRRLALEQEVAELKKQLSDEQTVHEILQRALQPSAGRSIALSIPAFIPNKAKELLAELVLVEDEIARLEAQIHNMKQGSGLSSSMQQQQQQQKQGTNGDDSAKNSSTMQQQQGTNGNDGAKNNSAEIKSMFFISQAMAMDGEYLLRNRAAAAAAVNSKRDSSGILGLSPRRSSDKAAIEAKQEDREKPPPALAVVAPRPGSKTSRREQPPNKLSERILKCLVCIFIRLLRSSRTAGESGGNLQGGFSSFRIDASLNVAAASLAKDKERGQQDHYGIFAVPDAIVRDIGPYKNLVRFTSASFDLRAFSTSPLLTKLRGMLEALQQVDLRFLGHHQKLAFWLNIYNICIMHGILQHGLPSNSEKLLALKNKATIKVSGQKFNALVIENFILRQPSSVKEEFWKCDMEVEEQQVRGLYGLSCSEPNILFALCCGIRSSPALRIYKANRVAADLEKAKLEYLQASLVVTSTRRLMIPGLVHSNMHDFAKDTESLVRWICDQLPTSWPLRKSMVDCLGGSSGGSVRGQHRHHLNLPKMEEIVDVIPFDYEFQYLLPV